MKNKLVLIFVLLISIISMFIISNKIFEENNKVVISATEIEKNKSISNINILAIYKENDNGVYEKQEDGKIPQEGYTIDKEKSVCSNNAIPSWNKDTKSLIINNLSKSGTSCYLFYKLSLADKTLTKLFPDYETKDNGTKFLTGSNGVLRVTGVDEGDNKNTLYKAEDNDGVSYFFRGQANNNWVQFANMRWRIIRINGDGTIRMIFQCSGADCKDSTEKNTNVESGVAYKERPHDDNTYVGYYYGTVGANTYEETHKTLASNPSTIAEVVNSWYTASGLSNYEQYIDLNAGFCNDRQVVTGVNSSYNGTGIGTSATSYAAYGRVYKNGARDTQYPSLKCGVSAKTAEEQESNVEVDNVAYQRDLFTKMGANKGNEILPHPIGLITADEVLLAGGYWGGDNSSYYLYTKQYYWTMSPNYFTGSSTSVFRVDEKGRLSSDYVSGTYGVRPVINLKADITFSGGTGTSDDPYVVQ